MHKIQAKYVATFSKREAHLLNDIKCPTYYRLRNHAIKTAVVVTTNIIMPTVAWM